MVIIYVFGGYVDGFYDYNQAKLAIVIQYCNVPIFWGLIRYLKIDIKRPKAELKFMVQELSLNLSLYHLGQLETIGQTSIN